MPTVRWSDVDLTEAAGEVAFKDMLISVGTEQIAHWQADPDGRFGIAITTGADGRKTAELAKFYPSL